MLAPSTRSALLFALLLTAGACTLSHEVLSTGDTPDHVVVANDGGLDGMDVPQRDIVVTEMPDIVVALPDGMDVQMDRTPPIDIVVPIDMIVPPDMVVPIDVPQDIPQDIPTTTTVPPGGDCSASGAVCATGTQCFTFVSGGAPPTTTHTCGYCGTAGERACAVGTHCGAGTMEDSVSNVCVRSDINTMCGGPGGGCESADGTVTCHNCGSGYQCVTTAMTILNTCIPCGAVGQPCCCSGPAGSETCNCASGATCMRGGSDHFTVCPSS